MFSELRSQDQDKNFRVSQVQLPGHKISIKNIIAGKKTCLNQMLNLNIVKEQEICKKLHILQ